MLTSSFLISGRQSSCKELFLVRFWCWSQFRARDSKKRSSKLFFCLYMINLQKQLPFCAYILWCLYLYCGCFAFRLRVFVLVYLYTILFQESYCDEVSPIIYSDTELLQAKHIWLSKYYVNSDEFLPERDMVQFLMKQNEGYTLDVTALLNKHFID